MCELQLRDCHAWQSNGLSFALVVLALSMLLVPAGWPQQFVAVLLLAVVVYQGMTNHKRTDELIYGAHRLMALTQELRGKQMIIEGQNASLAAQVDARTVELSESNLRLAAANLELLELDKLRSAVLSNVSHELRTPLTGILGSAQNLRDGLAGSLTAEQREYVQMIEHDSARLIRVVGELLEWGRLQSGHIHLQREGIAVDAMLDEVFMLVQPQAQGKGVVLAHEAKAAATVQADADKLKQILINLVENAVKFSPPGARVQVRTQGDRAGLRVEVMDQGPGIPEEDVGHVFERFYRGRNAQAAPGSGLGLAIAKNLARLHGGDIALQSRPGEGCTFTLELPAARAGVS